MSYLLVNGAEPSGYLLSFEVEKSLSSAGRLRARFYDPNGAVSGSVDAGDIVEAYADGVKVFKGVIENISTVKRNRRVYTELEASDLTVKLLFKLARKSYVDATISSIVDDLISSYFPEFSKDIDTVTQTITIKFNYKPVFECIKQLADMVGYTFWVDKNATFHFKPRRTGTELGTWNSNEITSFEKREVTEHIKNVLHVYGAESGGQTVVVSVRDEQSIGRYGVREGFVKDESLKTVDQARELGKSLLADLAYEKNSLRAVLSWKDVDIEPGDIVTLSEPTVQGSYEVVSSRIRCVPSREPIVEVELSERVETLEDILSRLTRDVRRLQTEPLTLEEVISLYSGFPELAQLSVPDTVAYSFLSVFTLGQSVLGGDDRLG
ncbi:MAG: hypothetical protein AYL29_007680 [Candidatus Bathyarchaeota archaeon B24]|nr:MAG: hypothetical protein AYL29_007680 [Candidatus Bathyarchaeota archaeon B24]